MTNKLNWFKNSLIEQRHNDIWCSLVLWNQWWDEWKWKLTDRLMQESDVVIRFNWWHNAWHSVKVWDKEFDLHILPSGMVTEGKQNIITSGCVLGINLNKIDISLFEWKNAPFDFTLEQLLKRKNRETIEVWLIPELEKLRAWWIDIKKSWLKISAETPIIWMHNVLLDAYDEISRLQTWLKPIWSTWSGISRAYWAEINRYHFSLNDLLNHEDNFYDSIRALWMPYSFVFPKIGCDELIEIAKKERQKFLKYIRSWEIELIQNEKAYINQLYDSWKKIIWEWAQSSMIGSQNSIFWTASNPSLQRFCQFSWLNSTDIWNVVLVHKIPPSSVWERPWYLKYPESNFLDVFRKKYWEVWVSTWRARDLFFNSIYESARGTQLNVEGIDDESKIVPVYNRVDGIEDMLELDNGRLRVAIWYSHLVKDIISWDSKKVDVGAFENDTFNPWTLLRNYPQKSEQIKLFELNLEDVRFLELSWNIQEKIQSLLWLYNWSIFKNDNEIEYLIWTWPERDDLEILKWTPIRSY